jgi:hypothetical protein
MPISVGDMLKENVLREQFVVSSVDFDSDTPFWTRTPQLDWVRGFGVVLVVEDYTRSVAHTAADAVVASTGNWRFDNGAFTAADVGGTITVANASHSGNNGTFTILTVPSATHVTTATTGLTDETFGVTVTMSITSAPLQASTEVEVTNDYTNATLPSLGQNPSEGHWANVDDMFSPAPPDITAAGNRFFQADPLDARTARIGIVPTDGASMISMFFCAKGPR